MDYLIYSISLLIIYVGLAQLLHVQFGLLGIPNFGVVGFWGAGMYLTGVFNVTLGIPIYLAILCATAIVALIAWGLGRMILDRSGQAILCATLAFSSIISVLVISEKWLTNGVRGLGTIRYPFSNSDHAELGFAVFIVIVVVAIFYVSLRLRESRLGRVLSAIRDNEELAASLGKNTSATKMLIFAITCGMMAFLGGLSAPLNQFLVPYLLSPTVTFTVWIALVLGGKGHSFGSIVGVILTVGLFDILIETYLPLPPEYAATIQNLKLFFYGALLVAVIMFRPVGLLGSGTMGARRSKTTTPAKTEAAS